MCVFSIMCRIQCCFRYSLWTLSSRLCVMQCFYTTRRRCRHSKIADCLKSDLFNTLMCVFLCTAQCRCSIRNGLLRVSSVRYIDKCYKIFVRFEDFANVQCWLSHISSVTITNVSVQFNVAAGIHCRLPQVG